jgi:MFS family permease
LQRLVALRSPNFLWLLASTMATYLGIGMQLTAVSWLALVTGGGAFVVGLVLAARMLPNLLFGLASGTLADHADRRRLIVSVRVISLVPALGLALLASVDTTAVWPLVVLAFATGSTIVFDTPTRQALVVDTTPRELAPNAMALNATMSRLSTAVGALAAGASIPGLGLPVCFLASSGIFIVAALLSLPIKPRPTGGSSLVSIRPRFGQALMQGALLALHFAEVRTLLLAAVACEIFGFSYQTAVPVFARDVLGAGAEGVRHAERGNVNWRSRGRRGVVADPGSRAAPTGTGTGLRDLRRSAVAICAEHHADDSLRRPAGRRRLRGFIRWAAANTDGAGRSRSPAWPSDGTVGAWPRLSPVGNL